jgi:hypothetical protein
VDLRSQTPAAELAKSNYRRNLEALASTHPWLELPPDLRDGLEWVFARDGSLTAFSGGTGFLHGCSVPRQLAEQLFRGLELIGRVGCYPLPMTSHHLAVALERLQPSQALIAYLPEISQIDIFLGLNDFSRDIRSGRLYLASGSDAGAAVLEVLQAFPGLAIPSQFIRTPVPDPLPVEKAMREVQSSIAPLLAQRRQQAQAGVEATTPTHGLCFIAPLGFRWFDDGGRLLATLKTESDILLNPDQPACSSPEFVAVQAATRNILVVPDRSRGELPFPVSRLSTVVTWMTLARVPSASGRAPGDLLLISDPQFRASAVRAGWPEATIHLAARPHPDRPASEPGRHLLLACDLLPLDAPPQVQALSTHSLFWDALSREVQADPSILGQDPAGFLERQRERHGISDEGFARHLFLDYLLDQAHIRGVARVLAAADVPIRIFGRGWETIPELSRNVAGTIDTFEALRQELDGCWAVLNPHPRPEMFPEEDSGAHVLSRRGSLQRLVAEARAILSQSRMTPSRRTPVLSRELILRLTGDGSRAMIAA